MSTFTVSMSEDPRMRLITKEITVESQGKGTITVESIGSGVTGVGTVILYIMKDDIIWDNLGLECIWQFGRVDTSTIL